MSLLRKRVICLLPLLVKSCALLAVERAEFYLEDTDLVTLNDTQLVNITGASPEPSENGISLHLNESQPVEMTISVTSGLAIFHGDQFITELNRGNSVQNLAALC